MRSTRMLVERTLLPLILLVSVAPASLAQQPGVSRMPTASPEARRIVDAISGDWSGHMTASIPGFKPETFPWDIRCKSAALGFGAACTLEGTASIGPLAESCLLAYDPEHKTIHYMCVTSTGEVHDHQGQWASDKTIEFLPYKMVMMGEPAVEIVRLTFSDPKTLNTESIVTTESGARMTFRFTGERR